MSRLAFLADATAAAVPAPSKAASSSEGAPGAHPAPGANGATAAPGAHPAPGVSGPTAAPGANSAPTGAALPGGARR